MVNTPQNTDSIPYLDPFQCFIGQMMIVRVKKKPTPGHDLSYALGIVYDNN